MDMVLMRCVPVYLQAFAGTQSAYWCENGQIELNWAAACTLWCFGCMQAVTHPSTDPGRCRETWLIENSALQQSKASAIPDSQLVYRGVSRNLVRRGQPLLPSSPPFLSPPLPPPSSPLPSPTLPSPPLPLEVGPLKSS